MKTSTLRCVYAHVAGHQPTNARIAADYTGYSFATCKRALRRLVQHDLVMESVTGDGPAYYLNKAARVGDIEQAAGDIREEAKGAI